MTVIGPAGWAKFAADARSLAWAAAARTAADKAVADPANAHWMRCEGTWFAGVNVLDTAPLGSVEGVPLEGPALDAVRAAGLWPRAWDRAQVSVVYAGYPKPKAGEGAGAFRYRRDRDAAHVDGLMALGPERRRFAREFHAFLLGLPLSRAGAGAAPFVVWEGSHEIIGRAFREALDGKPCELWGEVDLTEVYHSARRHVFETCRRVEIHAAPGEAYLVHRLALHGIAPWKEGVTGEREGRIIAYFRPETAPEAWLSNG